jgi:hypothetical protein
VKYGGPPVPHRALPASTRFFRYDTFQTTNYLAIHTWKCDRDIFVWPNLLHKYASEPWEVEEVACVNQYIIERFEKIIARVDEDPLNQSLLQLKTRQVLVEAPTRRDGTVKGWRCGLGIILFISFK